MSGREGLIASIDGVYREFRVARIAGGSLARELQADPSRLRRDGLSGLDARALHDNLEKTFLIRLFAEFEAGLRDVGAMPGDAPASRRPAP